MNFDAVYDMFEGWTAYAKNADTFNLRKKIISGFKIDFENDISSKDINRYLKTYRKRFCCQI